MNCPNCGAHVAEQRKFRRKRPASHATRLYKRVFMRAKRCGLPLPQYVRTHVALYRLGQPHDEEALEIPARRAS